MKRTKTKRSEPEKLHRVTVYARAVVDGDILTGRLVRLACERHLHDLERGHDRGIRFDVDLADHAIDFFPKFLKHTEGEFADQEFKLSPHQIFIVGSLFGWVKADGYRRFRHLYWEEAKGSGKTPTGSGMLIYGLTLDGEQGGEIYCAAVTRDQAGIAFKDCKHMAEKSAFADRLSITEHNIAYEETNSFIRPVSSEARSLDGKRVFMCLLDEIHEHATPLVVDKMVAGNKGRTQPLNLRITNSGYDRTSICWYEHEYSREVLEGAREDDDWFAYVAQLDMCGKCVSEGKTSVQDNCDECDHWWDEATWPKANANMGVSVTYDYLRGEVRKALAMPSKAMTVKRLNFCIWTEGASHWLPMDDWDQCAGSVKALELREFLKGRRCFAGLDLADTTDTASLVLIFPVGELFFILTFVWIPEDMTKRTGQERTRFQQWASQGFVEPTPGNLIDYRYILETIAQCQIDYDLKMLAFDRRGAATIITALCDGDGATFSADPKDADLTGKPLLVQFGQGFESMSSSTKEFANLVLAHRIVHGGNPVMRWMVGNVVIDVDPAQNEKPNKGKSTEKIDAAVAAIMGLDLAIRNVGSGDEKTYFWSL